MNIERGLRAKELVMANRILITIAVLVSVVAGVVAAQSAPPKKDIPTIAKAAKGAIVTIVMANNDQPIARGTGFVVRPDGVIVTNYHVIATGNVAVVKFQDGTILAADGVLAADKVRDLAIIKIHGKTFQTLTLGDSDQVQVGEEVVAIGNPLGLELTVSNGILSGVRTVQQAGGKFLQITAPISPGSSGGPLFNLAGEVVGITSMVFEGGENLNFAIPVNDAKQLLLNQYANLRSFPNEADSETPKPRTPQPNTGIPKPKIPGPERKQTCSEQATKFNHYNSPKSSDIMDVDSSGFLSHFDLKSKRCFVEMLTHVTARGDKVDDKLFRSNTHAYSHWGIYIYDASEEGTHPWYYGAYEYGSGTVIACSIFPQGLGDYINIYTWHAMSVDAPEIQCRSKEEFDDLALKYFGITHLTAPIN